jgi:hypothetical protein
MSLLDSFAVSMPANSPGDSAAYTRWVSVLGQELAQGKLEIPTVVKWLLC